MFKIKILAILLSLNCFAHPVVNVFGDADQKFISFWSSEYYKWAYDEFKLAEKFTGHQLKLIKHALGTYSSWAQKSGDFYRDNFRFGFRVVNKKVRPSFYISINEQIKNEGAFKNFIQQLGVSAQGLSAIEFFGINEGVDLYYKNTMTSIRAHEKVNWQFNWIDKKDFVSTKRLVNNKYFFSQSLKTSGDSKCYETRFRTISLQNLPTELVKIATLHENTWNTLIGGVEECDGLGPKIFFP
ncbi:MAG: hypothetical protein KC478_03400 [Bacteriovoracaceae bacterium]|nr:hypothetical protein [Bacteriovoracaceae bacterium]